MSAGGCPGGVARGADPALLLRDLRRRSSNSHSSIAGAGVSEDGFIVITAEFSENELVEATIAVGPDGTCACKISAGEAHVAATAPGRALVRAGALKDRLAEVGARGEAGKK